MSVQRKLLLEVMNEAWGTGSRLAMEPATATLRDASVRRKILRVSCHKSHKTVDNKVKYCLQEVLIHYSVNGLLHVLSWQMTVSRTLQQRRYVTTCARPSLPRLCFSPSSSPSSCPHSSSTGTTRTRLNPQLPLLRWLSADQLRLTPSASLVTTYAAARRNPSRPRPLKYL